MAARRNRGRPVRYDGPETRFTLGEYRSLEQMLLSQPARVLEQFPVVGIGSLSELDTYHRLKHTHPERVTTIEACAAMMGIPLSLSESAI